ncbi:hypothetical protein CDAR_43071 [Caerostris darwini]|uniref:Uncharacterized protein n=1 Tax=Caerostris darwini TaxID=1538125 RepID=A0AAV4WG70_9ARAC|nr:hypothetical protein CDAR_43071 [Caerostris darwini]
MHGDCSRQVANPIQKPTDSFRTYCDFQTPDEVSETDLCNSFKQKVGRGKEEVFGEDVAVVEIKKERKREKKGGKKEDPLSCGSFGRKERTETSDNPRAEKSWEGGEKKGWLRGEAIVESEEGIDRTGRETPRVVRL